MSSNVIGRPILIATVVLVATSLGGCGFKSDLFIPEAENESPLFVPDAPAPGAEAEVGVQEDLPFLPSSENAEGEEIRLEEVTAAATDGNILVTPGDGNVEGTDSEGVSVDLTDLTRDVKTERERNAQ